MASQVIVAVEHLVNGLPVTKVRGSPKTKVDSMTEGIIHSHPNTSDYDAAPGYDSKTSGDHMAVDKGIPNMVTRKGTTVVVEKVNGQYRVRTVQGKLTRSERRTTKERVRKFQKAGRKK